MGRYARYVAASIISLFIFITVILIKSPQDRNEGIRYYLNNLLGKKCITYNQGIFSRRLSDKIPDYIEISSRSGIPRCETKSDLRKRVAHHDLIRITGGKGYIVADLSHSYPYLTKEGAVLLSDIGKRFRSKISDTRLRGSDFRVTSMTRTTEVLKELRASNSNASENSPHFYGNAFDISYVKFSAHNWFVTDCDKYYLKEALAEVIYKLREEKRCWATYEINQGCFHVVAR